MSDLNRLTKEIIKFRNERDWKQFHNPKDVAISLALESAEFLEHFQWKSEQEIKDLIRSKKTELGDELADVLYWVLLISHDLGIDLRKAALSKLAKNRKKYPIRKAKGKHTKYTSL